jgi:hypothetical protein
MRESRGSGGFVVIGGGNGHWMRRPARRTGQRRQFRDQFSTLIFAS